MRVYQFLNASDGLAVLGTRRLRISRLDKLNDPFEFLGADLSKKKHRGPLSKMKAQMALNRGILCFSCSWRNPILWGHYAGKHQGFCLGFDMPTKHLTQMRYVTARLPWPDKLSIGFMKQVFTSKFVHWSYEEEFRAWVALNDIEDGYYYFPFSEELTLREVIVGAESILSRTDVDAAIGDLRSSVEVFKVRPAFR